MLGDLQAHRRQDVDLTTVMQEGWLVSARGVTVSSPGWWALHDLVGRRHQIQRLPAMARLPACLLPALHAQTLGLALESVTAGRLSAGAAVVGPPRFEMLHASQQRPHLLPQADALGFHSALRSSGVMVHATPALQVCLTCYLTGEPRHF